MGGWHFNVLAGCMHGAGTLQEACWHVQPSRCGRGYLARHTLPHHLLQMAPVLSATQFLLISDSDIPLYDPLTFYQQVRCVVRLLLVRRMPTAGVCPRAQQQKGGCAG